MKKISFLIVEKIKKYRKCPALEIIRRLSQARSNIVNS